MKKKRSVASRVTGQTVHVLLLAMAALLTMAFFVARNSVMKETRNFSFLCI